MSFLRNKFVVSSYFSVVFVALLFLITEYSFTNNFFDVAIITILIIYPISIFLSLKIRTWLKISASLLVSLLVALALWNLPVALAFSDKTIYTIRKWDVGTKRVILEKQQGWAGSPYLEYQLMDFKIFGLIVKNVATGYPGSVIGNECKINLETNSLQTVYEFDHCSGNLKRLE